MYLKKQMEKLIAATEFRMQQVMQLIASYEKQTAMSGGKKDAMIVDLKAQLSLRELEDKQARQQLEEALEQKEKECLMLNSLLGKKQEDLLFALHGTPQSNLLSLNKQSAVSKQ